MQIQPYISFNGNCREAVEFYADVFGTDKPEIMLFGEMPTDTDYVMSDETQKLVLHTELAMDETKVMFSDIPPNTAFTQGNNMTLIIISDDLDEIKILYYKLKDGGTVDMELQETFWSKYYGSLTDKFGVGWQLNYDDGRMSQLL